jgi:photosystem II stability/assembly factor-like uncharacterized protein
MNHQEGLANLRDSPDPQRRTGKAACRKGGMATKRKKMKRIFTALFFLLLFSMESRSQTWTRMQSWGLDLESIVWITETEGVVAGENLIIRTSDGGVTWDEVLQKFDTRFADVAFLSNGNGVAVGDKGTIYTSSDFGKSWVKRESGTLNNLRSVARTAATQLVAVGQNGEILQSFNSGMTWAKVSSGTNLGLNHITFVNENTAFIAADQGRILKSFDSGSTWNSSIIAPNRDLFGVEFADPMTGYAVGHNGLFLKSSNGGESWTELVSSTTQTLRKVAVSPLDIRVVVAVGDTATIVRTVNAGSTFSKLNLGAGNTRLLKNLGFKPNSAHVSAVGQDGYLLNSTNSGANWVQKFAGIRNNFTAVDFKNLNTGYIAGENGGLFVTSNGAVTLFSRPIPEPILIQTIDFWNTSYGFTSSAGGKIFRTGNSGSNWVPLSLSVNRTISGFYLFAPSVIYAAGDNGYITRSTDSGVTWDQTVKSNTAKNLKDVTFFDFVFGFAIGEDGQISRSAGGNEWETLPKVTAENLNALAKLNADKAIIVGNKGTILKTEDKAKTWRKIDSGTEKNLNSISFFGENVGFIAADEGLALVTLDGGETWIRSSAGTIRDLTAVSAGTDSKAYFVGDDGSIITYNCIPPVGTLGEITGEAKSCLATSTYSVSQMPSPGSEIIWRIDGGEIISGQGTSQIVVKWSTPGRNAVLVSRSNFCGSGETSALEVEVIPTPAVNLTVAGEGAVCKDITYSYSLPKFDGTTYTWNVAGGEISQGQGTNKVEIKWTQSGQHRLSVSQENRCGTAAPILKTITVNAAPESPMAITGEPRVGLGEQIYETAVAPGLNYRWVMSDGGRILAGQGTGRVVVLWEKEGNFELAVDAQNECGFSPKRTLAVNVNIITALEPFEDGDLKIFPNPSQGNLTISSKSLDSFTTVLVFNPVGQLVETQSISAYQHEMRFHNLPKGLLLIQLHGKNGVISRKLLVR